MIAKLYTHFLAHPVVTTDSRNCPEGSIFFALKGERFDGNKFAGEVLGKGCSLAVVDDASVIPVGDSRYFLVPDVLTALQQLAAYHRQQFKTWEKPVSVIGITGTNGKTTTKELIHAVMSQAFNTLATKGNLNNQIGVPLTVLGMDRSNQYAIIEMGASHPGDIRELVGICNPDWGIITNVGKAHLLGFGSFEGVKSTKGELYDFIRADLSFLNQSMARDYNKELPLAVMPMLPFGNARFRDVHTELPMVCRFQQFREAATVIYIHF